MFEIGDKLQAYDGRIGTVVDTKMVVYASSPEFQHIVVRFPDGSQMNGLAQDFKAVFERPFAKVGQRH